MRAWLGEETQRKETTWDTQAQMGKNIKMDLKEWDGRAWQSIVHTFIKLWLPQNVRNSLIG